MSSSTIDQYRFTQRYEKQKNLESSVWNRAFILALCYTQLALNKHPILFIDTDRIRSADPDRTVTMIRTCLNGTSRS